MAYSRCLISFSLLRHSHHLFPFTIALFPLASSGKRLASQRSTNKLAPQLSTNTKRRCSDIIVGSQCRKSRWRHRELNCKCSYGWVVQGDAPECKPYLSERYFPDTLRPSVCNCGMDPGLNGIVEILQDGPFLGKKAAVSHYDFRSNSYCVVEYAEPPKDLGCFKRHVLKQVNREGGFVQSVNGMVEECSGPSKDRAIIKTLEGLHNTREFFGTLFGRRPKEGIDEMSSDWADQFTIGFYVTTLSSVRAYKTRHAKKVKIPVRVGRAPEIGVGNVSAPLVDIDKTDGFNALQSQHGFFSFDCILDALSNVPFDDALNTNSSNTWSIVMADGRHSRKKDWLLQYYTPYHQGSGEPIWPPPENVFESMFLKGDIWDDKLENAMAFDLIGAHRVDQVHKLFQGEVLPYAVRLNKYAKIGVRPGFSRLGADLFFTATGLPALIVTPDGVNVSRGSKDWQYWKFVWRSTLVTVITLVDHLHVAHFQAGNVLARTSRQCLSPNHPLRRLLTIFTFWTISTNRKSMHTLLRSDHSLHRASPVERFEDLTESVHRSLPTLPKQHKKLAGNHIFQSKRKKLPWILKKTPYYSDGLQLYKVLRSLVADFRRLFEESFCGARAEIKSFREELRIAGELYGRECDSDEASTDTCPDWAFSGYCASNNTLNCYDTAGAPPTGQIPQCGVNDADTCPSGMKKCHKIVVQACQLKICNDLQKWLVAALWSATGWHRHVGTVADFYADPDLASSSWVEGEAFGRPKQHLILSVIASFTSTKQPKLSEDYSRVFAGMPGEEKAVKMMQDFRDRLAKVAKRVKKRNAMSLIQNPHADPDVVESSVAV